MKHTQKIITQQRQQHQVDIPDITFESFIPFMERHDSLSAAKVLLGSQPSNEMCDMAAILMESMGLGETVSLESFGKNPHVALEAAQEENLASAKKKASDFSKGMMGWIQKTFTARGKLFKEIDELITRVTAVENQKCELSADDKKKWGAALAINSTFEGTLSDFKQTYDVVEKATFARLEGSLNALKSGTDPSRAYDGLIENYVKTVTKVIPVNTGTPKQGILGSPIEMYIGPHSKIGISAFVLSANMLDIKGIKNQKGEIVSDPSHVAHFYEAISSRTYTVYDEIMSASSSQLPTSFKEIKNILVMFRGILDDCLNVDAMKRLEKIASEQGQYIQKVKLGEQVLFANWLITNSNVAAGSLLFKTVDAAMYKISQNMIGWVQASLNSVK